MWKSAPVGEVVPLAVVHAGDAESVPEIVEKLVAAFVSACWIASVDHALVIELQTEIEAESYPCVSIVAETAVPAAVNEVPAETVLMD